MLIEEEFVSLYDKTVKLHLKHNDGSFKNSYHHYKTVEKAKLMYRIYLAGIEGRKK